MVGVDERELLLRSLKGYLDELKESGVEELPFGPTPLASAQSAVAPPAAVKERGAVPLTGSGNRKARLLFIGPGVGFEGASGTLLSKIVIAMGFAPEEVYLLSFPEERGAEEELRLALAERISEVAPEVVVALGELAAQILLQSGEPIARLRGRFKDLDGARLMATLHPDQLVADETLKREVWNEMKQVISLLSGKA